MSRFISRTKKRLGTFAVAATVLLPLAPVTANADTPAEADQASPSITDSFGPLPVLDHTMVRTADGKATKPAHQDRRFRIAPCTQVQPGWPDLTYQEHVQLTRKLKRQGGITCLRAAMQWHELQPDRPKPGDNGIDHGYLRHFDRVVNMSTRKGMHVMINVIGAPPWTNNGHDPTVPAYRNSDVRRLGEWVGAHYAGNRMVRKAEYLNETNSEQFYKRGAEWYTGSLCAFNRGINATYPRMQVVAAGTAGIDVDYTRQLLRYGAGKCSDHLAVHPYTKSVSPLSDHPVDAEHDLRTLAVVIRLLHKYHDKGCLYATEAGYSTHSNDGIDNPMQHGVTPRQQARYTIQELHQLNRLGVCYWSVYGSIDRLWGSSENNKHFGLFRRPNSHGVIRPKPVVARLDKYNRIRRHHLSRR